MNEDNPTGKICPCALTTLQNQLFIMRFGGQLLKNREQFQKEIDRLIGIKSKIPNGKAFLSHG